jgi:hypothetical protein
MRRQFIAQIARLGCRHTLRDTLQMLMQQHDLLLHQIQLFLLAEDAAIEFIDQVFRKAQLGFKFIDAGFRRLGFHIGVLRLCSLKMYAIVC